MKTPPFIPARFAGLASARLAGAGLCLLLGSNTAFANPTGPEVVHGDVTILEPGPGMLEIHNSDGAIIQWRDFSIGAGETTLFNQPGADSSVLNRVTGQDPSEILGNLVSNGRVFLINPNGILFGEGARVDTAGLIASSLNLSDADFIARRYRFENGDRAGAVVNRGYIRAGRNGQVILIAPDVQNHGIIETDHGDILLAAGRKLTLLSLDSEHISFDVQAPQDRAINLGKLLANGGAAAMFAGTVHQHGRIEADRMTRDADGTIRLVASNHVEVGGVVSAAGRNGQAGGRVEITGASVELTSATVDASGDTGGGRVLIGGDYQGNGTLANARATRIDAASTVSADATGKGDGGTVVIWSEDHTRVDGAISARGGRSGGNGGLVETSSRGQLDFSRPVDVSARNGRGGLWLLDPEDITIDSGKAASIVTALNQGSNVAIKTAETGTGKGDITVASSIEKTAGGDANLSLTAHNRIDVNAPISSSSGKLDVSLTAGNAIAVNSGISTNGGNVKTKIESNTPDLPGSGDTTAVTETGTSTPTKPGTPTTTTDLPTAGTTTVTDIGKPVTMPPTTVTTAPESTTGTTGPGTTGDSGSNTGSGVTVVAGTDSATTPAPSGTATTTRPKTESSGDGNSSSTKVADGPGKTDTTSTGEKSQQPTTTGGTTTVASGPGTTPSTPDKSTEVVEVQPGITVDSKIITGGGKITVDSGSKGTTRVAGELNTSSNKSGTSGGNIEVLGETVEVQGDAVIDASGDAGGGTILIGGDLQGSGDTRTATRTTVAKGASIRSDATTSGDGGKIIVWANDTTEYRGQISATGGSQSGDGGLVEVSGKQHLLFDGLVDTSAANGATGQLLLDPGKVIIDSVTDTQPDTFNNALLASTLGSTNVTILTSAATGANGAVQDIDVLAPVVWNSVNSLSLVAGNNINVGTGANLTNAGSGGVSLQSGGTGTINIGANLATTGTVTINGIGSGGVNQTAGTISADTLDLTTNGGATLNQSNNINTLSVAANAGGAVQVTTSGNLDLNSTAADAINSASAVTLNVGGNLTQTKRIVTNANALNVTAAGAINLNSPTNSIQDFTASSTAAGDVTLVTNVGLLTTNGISNPNGAVSVTNDGAVTVAGTGINASGNVLVKSSDGSNVTINNSIFGNDVTLEAWNGATNYGDILVGAPTGATTVYAQTGSLFVTNADRLTLQGGSTTNAHVDVKAANGMTLTLQEDLRILGGTSDSDALLQNLGGNQNITANAIRLVASSDSEARLNNLSGAGSQTITTTGNTGGEAIRVESNGTAAMDVAEIYHGGSGTQTITLNGNGGDLTVLGNANGGDALISSIGNQTITINGTGSDLTLGSGSGTGSSVIKSGGNQSIDAGGNDVTLNAGLGSNASAALDSNGALTLIDAGSVTLNGGSTGTGSKAAIRANGNLVLGTSANPMGSVTVSGGTSGTNMDAAIVSTGGSVAIHSTGDVVLNGGDSNNSEAIIEGESVTITADDLLLNGGGTATDNHALLWARNGNVDVNATNVNLTAGTGISSDAVLIALNGSVNLNLTGLCIGCGILPGDPRFNGATETGIYTVAPPPAATTPPPEPESPPPSSSGPDQAALADAQKGSVNAILSLGGDDESDDKKKKKGKSEEEVGAGKVLVCS